MILNISPDDKFVPFLLDIFEEAVPGESLWRVYTDKPTQSFAALSDRQQVVGRDYFWSEAFKLDIQKADSIIFHSFFLTSLEQLLVLLQLPKNTPVLWRGWGADYYSILQAKGMQLILPETSTLMGGDGSLKRVFVKQFPKKLLNAIISRIAGQYINSKLIERVNYFSCCVPDEFEVLQRGAPNFGAQFLPLNYYSAEDIFLRGDNLQDLSGRDILLGNSATASNNHIEAMRVLSKLGMVGRKVVVPLSYGDMKYKEKILKVGADILGESFVPLISFMPLAEYNQAVSGCGNLVMNHIRQQAMGNISSALLRGGRVFLRPENPIYRYYTRMGVKLSPFIDGMTIQDLDTPLSRDDVLKNKEILLNIWSRAQGIKHVKAISQLGK